MKRKIIGALTTIPFIATLTMSGSCATSCPFGMVNCTGQCSRFTDADSNGFCDLSQTVTSTSDPSTIDASTSVDDPASPSLPDQNSSQPDLGANASTFGDNGHDSGGFHLGDGEYHILPISLLLIGSYLFTYFLFKKGILSRKKHHKLWNLLLTLGYIGTSSTGVFLVLIINLGIRTTLNHSITYWHAELAILMVIGTLIHVHIYKKAIKNMFKVLFRFKSSKNKKSKMSINGVIRRYIT